MALRLLRPSAPSGPQPTGRGEKNDASQDESQIARGEPQDAENQDVAQGNQDRGNKDDKKCAVHFAASGPRRAKSGPDGVTVPAGTAPGSSRSPTEPRRSLLRPAACPSTVW